MRHGLRSKPLGGFSLVEVLIAIVVLALGLLGIAAVFPAVVKQQRSTTDALQGTTLSRSIDAVMRAHYGANKQSIRHISGVNAGVVPGAELRGWMSLVGFPTWSTPVAARMALGDYDGDWDLPRTGANPAGIRLNAANGDYMVMGDRADVRLDAAPAPAGYSIPGFLLDAEQRKIGEDYIFDFAARRIGAGRPFQEATPADALLAERTCQDDMIQLALFVRRVDKRYGTPAVGVDVNGRPTFNSTGAYSMIGNALYTFTPVGPTDPPVDPGTTVVTLNSAQVNYLRQVGQKFVTQWGTVHTVSALRAAANDVVVKPEIDRVKAALYPASGLQFLYTPQVPVAVEVITIEPAVVN